MNAKPLDNVRCTYRLPFDHVVIAELSVAPDWYFVTVYRPDKLDYVTYQCNAHGDCSWGHYGIYERGKAIIDMIKRSPIPIITVGDLVDAENEGKLELNA